MPLAYRSCRVNTVCTDSSISQLRWLKTKTLSGQRESTLCLGERPLVVPRGATWSWFCSPPPLWSCGGCGWAWLLVDGVVVFASGVESFGICMEFHYIYKSARIKANMEGK